MSKATKKDYVKAMLPRYELHIGFQVPTGILGQLWATPRTIAPFGAGIGLPQVPAP